jgi:hypothetical protein
MSQNLPAVPAREASIVGGVIAVLALMIVIILRRRG